MNGVTTHSGTYTYDGAGRLITVVDTATSTTENYVWNTDGTLASSATITTAYEYANERATLVHLLIGILLVLLYIPNMLVYQDYPIPPPHLLNSENSEDGNSDPGPLSDLPDE